MSKNIGTSLEMSKNIGISLEMSKNIGTSTWKHWGIKVSFMQVNIMKNEKHLLFEDTLSKVFSYGYQVFLGILSYGIYEMKETN